MNTPKIKDIDIRIILRQTLSTDFKEYPDTVIIDEFGIKFREVIADVAVFNGTTHGYEIKSEVDSLKRLPNQMEYYSKIFEYVTVVIARNHLNGVLKIIPNWVGIMIVERSRSDYELRVKRLRKSRKNTNLDKGYLLDLLNREELTDLSKENNIKGTRSLPIYQVRDNLSELLSISTIKEAVNYYIKARKASEVECQLA